MLPDSHYDKEKADRAVAFIENLCHTKGKWAGKPFLLLPWQEQIVRDLFGIVKEDGKRQFLTAYIEIPKKNGKQLALDTPIPTPDGWKTMGTLAVGDCVFDERGKPCYVVAKSLVDDTEQAYELVFRDGGRIVAGERHLWDVEYIHGKTRAKRWTTGEIYRRTRQYRETFSDNRSIIRIPVNEPLHLPEANLPVDPYLYGYWLGNGCATKPEITVRDCDVDDLISFIPYPLHNRYPQTCGGSEILVYKELKNILVPHFREKVIRPEYLRSSEHQRWELLQGLMDSDGCVSDVKGQSIYVSTIRQLAESVQELLWTLGIKNSLTTCPSTRYGEPTGEILYQIRFTAFTDQPVSKLHRKSIRRQERVKQTRSCFHYLKEIRMLDYKVKMQCIQVDSPSHCYLAGRNMVKTHNSELAAAIALYLLYADNEPSAEVYGAACDRNQASIVFDVARQMVEMSPALLRRSKIRSAGKRIINYRNAGFYQVLSAETGTKHGLNVSGLVFDEIHAQPNRKLYDVLTKGSGDAREQPLFFIITTAGNDKNSICYELHTKALDLMQGRKKDYTFYPVVYGLEADEDWTDEANWYKANPSLGHTIKIERVREAYQNAIENPAEENVFKQLRLNIWTSASIRWIPEQVYDKGNLPIDLDSLRGRMCYGGLDLSSTSDITALVLAFPPRNDDEKYILLPFFWLPEDTLELRCRRDHVLYDVWQKQGFIQTTEGNVIHYGFIEKFIERLGETYNIREIAYDRWNATQMVQNLEDMSFTMVPFGQGFKDMSPPSKELFKLLMEGNILHGGNPVLKWMAGNVVMRQDPAGNIKPDKEKSVEKIDGIVATIMALDRCIRNGTGSSSVYDERGVIAF
ncbi:terminase large subunit [Megasphaera elsdenii]|uniref:terminase large subunit n=1 Tax=Megasphaera elsdenii TaxID=907 RepID=UPI001D024D6B|nr:terminase TerL endonuclease subunit [Megasphaera elsdenii]MCB5702383.1 terminase large subunit [Megasphaera elsdenii]MCB5727166.1 terminase large subunit [Megasphaera elsdenii]MCB5770946.1 terminase large subunit [Megasphaera elsdenii]